MKIEHTNMAGRQMAYLLIIIIQFRAETKVDITIFSLNLKQPSGKLYSDRDMFCGFRLAEIFQINTNQKCHLQSSAVGAGRLENVDGAHLPEAGARQ